MGRYYEENYELLKQKLKRMVEAVQEMVDKTILALSTNDVELAQEVIERDEFIDHLEVEIDELVIKLLALQQPMAVDLRFLVAALKINNDLERMGDQAVNIAQNVLMLKNESERPHIVNFAEMEDVVQEMMHQSIAAFNTADVDAAYAVCERDDVVDEMNRNIIRTLASHSRTHPEDAERSISLLLISRNLERIADLSTNVAEEVVYYIQGRFIKHAPRSDA